MSAGLVSPMQWVWPFGDSLTRGTGSLDDNGYRGPLDRLLVGLFPRYTWVGTTASEGTDPRLVHNGAGGFTAQNGDTIAIGRLRRIHTPTVALVLFGSNDARLEVALNTTVNALESIRDAILGRNPRCAVLMGQNPPDTDAPRNAGIDAINDAILGISGVTPVDLNTGFDLAWLEVDGTHPDPDGYDYMADRWMDAIRAVA